eukprot:gnl/MRDRNA2_/MRDRNA2_100435_c0_seq1.p1 gnl/MRDRNA2_/MRDRNA2_100435_c0~~gnl/MRDRNA2_/MRDRNA2_100435_c0_seq1.p1  ORF type:complete len:422 (+),score=116.41 gnl/MRDRNA2_/MRDRNA2_100435_c0_seq1:101-1366(+)
MRTGSVSFGCTALGLLFSQVAKAAAAALRDKTSEQDVITAIKTPGFVVSSAAAEDVESFIHRGWHDAVRELIQVGHSSSDADASVGVAAHVRAAVTSEKNRLDDLVRILDKNYGKAAEVTPASQWAQNSTHVFMQVKFAQRWNAPGALEISNNTMEFTDCCMDFEAYGEHSMILRRYSLSLKFLEKIVPKESSWHLAAAGRMTITMKKAKVANWGQLVHPSTEAPKNLGTWRDMRDRWTQDLEKLVPTGGKEKPKEKKKDGKTKTKSKKKAAKDEDEEDEEALEKEVDTIGECDKGAFGGSSVAELCDKAWKVVSNPGLSRKWLIAFYNGEAVGEQQAMKELLPVWKRLAEVFPSTEKSGKVGAVDCSGVEGKAHCKRLGVKEKDLPQIRRYANGGEGKVWGKDVSDLESLMEFGAGKQEL